MYLAVLEFADLRSYYRMKGEFAGQDRQNEGSPAPCVHIPRTPDDFIHLEIS